MINYQSPNPKTKFIMLDKGIDDELSPDAYYLLIKYMKLAPNEDNSNNALKMKTGLSKRKFDRAKKELVSKGYLDTRQLHGNVYALYIGKESVRKYKKTLKKSHNRYEQNELKKFKKSIQTVAKRDCLNLESAKLRPSKVRWHQFETFQRVKKEELLQGMA